MGSEDSSPAPDVDFGREAQVFLSWVVGAGFIGAAIAFPHVLVVLVAKASLDWEIAKYVTIAVAVSYTVASAIGGLALVKLTEWALTQTRCRSLAVAVTVGMAASAVSLYSICHTSSVAAYVSWLFQRRYAHIYGAVLAGLYAILLGAFHWILSIVRLARLSPVGVVYMALLVATAAYFMAIVLWSAVRTTRRQRGIAQDLHCEPAAARQERQSANR